jgi:hypothetical protein
MFPVTVLFSLLLLILKPAVIPTTQASSFTLQYFSCYV